jgi:hypothetical protein
VVKDLSSDYNWEGDTVLIELRLDKVMQLFNTLDPTPFHSRDLDADAEEYIVGAAREFPLRTPLKLLLHLAPDACEDPLTVNLEQAIRHYFEYRTKVADRELRLKLWQGRISLLIGLVFLASCMSLLGFLETDRATTWLRLVQEGLLISGWVALWGPMEIFLYGWWPVYHTRAVYAKLSIIEVEVRSLEKI